MKETQRPATMADLDALAAEITAGRRRALARAITLIESSRPDHRADARGLLDRLAPQTGGSLRIGLTGAPGVGKSTFIEAFGAALTGVGERLAVLAVDPSSARTGGSILGDKTRMERLSRDPNAFIRPSPSRAALGGVAERTRDAMHLCEAAGFTVTLIETVGVGQSETMVADMTDVFVVLVAPGGGDELQGVKRGVIERADLVLVNKADGDLAEVARHTVADYASALRLLRPRADDPPSELMTIPSAAPVSALTGAGLEDARRVLFDLAAWRSTSGWTARRRRAQSLASLRRAIERGLVDAFDAAATPTLRDIERRVEVGDISPERGAREALEAFLTGRSADRSTSSGGDA